MVVFRLFVLVKVGCCILFCKFLIYEWYKGNVLLGFFVFWGVINEIVDFGCCNKGEGVIIFVGLLGGNVVLWFVLVFCNKLGSSGGIIVNGLLRLDDGINFNELFLKLSNRLDKVFGLLILFCIFCNIVVFVVRCVVLFLVFWVFFFFLVMNFSFWVLFWISLSFFLIFSCFLNFFFFCCFFKVSCFVLIFVEVILVWILVVWEIFFVEEVFYDFIEFNSLEFFFVRSLRCALVWSLAFSILSSCFLY